MKLAPLSHRNGSLQIWNRDQLRGVAERYRKDLVWDPDESLHDNYVAVPVELPAFQQVSYYNYQHKGLV